MSSQASANLRLIATAALFSTGGAAIKASSLGAVQVACLRSAIAAVTIIVLLPAARGGWSAATAAIGAGYAATMLLFVLANKLTTAASTIYLQSTAPLYICLLAPWLLGEKLSRRDLLFMAALAAGMSLFFLGAAPAPAGFTSPQPLLGNVAAVLSGVFWAFTVIGLRWAGRHEGGTARVVLAGNVVLVLACLPWALPFPGLRATDLMVVTWLGVFQIGLAYVLLSEGIRHVPALEASLILLVEPVLSPLWAWWLHGETPGASALAGGAIILGATAVRTWLDARRA